MSAVKALLQAQAAAGDRAVRATAYRHIHLTPAPLVVCAYNLSGEAAAPLAIMWGTSPTDSQLVVAAEPRNRESRFAAINAFAADFHTRMIPFLATKVETTRSGGEREVAIAAPQVITPNRATRDYLGARIGRSLRYLGRGNTHPVPPATSWTGSYLSWLAEHAHYPGQSIFLAATEALTAHYATGQSAMEDENLPTLLAWITNPPGSGLGAIRAAEQVLPLGPATHPRWEAQLEPVVAAYNTAQRAGNTAGMRAAQTQVEALASPPLLAAFTATLHAVELLASIPAAATVADRWAVDLREWGDNARRTKRGTPPAFARRHDPLRAAANLESWSTALEHLEADMAFDDPMIMAGLDADGLCLIGTATAVDTTNREVKPGNSRRTAVPLVTITLDGPTRLLPETDVVWAGDRRVKGVIRTVPAVGTTGEAVIAITAGHDRGSRLPTQRQSTLFTTLDPWAGFVPGEPDTVPWTHQPPPQTDTSQDGDPADDGSPDLGPDVLAALPQLGAVPPSDVPGVVL